MVGMSMYRSCFCGGLLGCTFHILIEQADDSRCGFILGTQLIRCVLFVHVLCILCCVQTRRVCYLVLEPQVVYPLGLLLPRAHPPLLLRLTYLPRLGMFRSVLRAAPRVGGARAGGVACCGGCAAG